MPRRSFRYPGLDPVHRPPRARRGGDVVRVRPVREQLADRGHALVVDGADQRRGVPLEPRDVLRSEMGRASLE